MHDLLANLEGPNFHVITNWKCCQFSCYTPHRCWERRVCFVWRILVRILSLSQTMVGLPRRPSSSPSLNATRRPIVWNWITSSLCYETPPSHHVWRVNRRCWLPEWLMRVRCLWGRGGQSTSDLSPTQYRRTELCVYVVVYLHGTFVLKAHWKLFSLALTAILSPTFLQLAKTLRAALQNVKN